MTLPPAFSLSSDSLLSVAQGCLSVEVDGEFVLMNVASGLYFGLDAVGSDIMARLAQPIRWEDLVSALAQDYDAPRAQIEQDSLILLADLAGHGLITVQD